MPIYLDHMDPAQYHFYVNRALRLTAWVYQQLERKQPEWFQIVATNASSPGQILVLHLANLLDELGPVGRRNLMGTAGGAHAADLRAWWNFHKLQIRNGRQALSTGSAKRLEVVQRHQPELSDDELEDLGLPPTSGDGRHPSG